MKSVYAAMVAFPLPGTPIGVTMYGHILVPLDGSATSERGLREAVQLASEQKAKVRLLHVIDDFPLLVQMSSAFNFGNLMAEARVAGEQLLAKGREVAANAGLQAETALLEQRPLRTRRQAIDTGPGGA
ncbi:universal stress protein [Variovorax sp. J22R133]|uniref:universal stress protein n=1 Tax=Variovorax brevis TaxID=3053503 RepID=UPI002574F32D|nr:universal stress protein [Variovorax sp. J22R133]MDM0116370.1 universal stress protein [Variovorax sp. J22R133]